MRAEQVQTARLAVRRQLGDYVDFPFEKMKPTVRKALVADIIALYEACLLDMGKMGDDCDFMYPPNEPPRKKRVRGRSKK